MLYVALFLKQCLYTYKKGVYSRHKRKEHFKNFGNSFGFFKFPLYICFPKFKKLKDLIIEKSRELFLTIGFKSVTMDHIAQDMGISKKTIYNYFKNKMELVNSVTNNLFVSITQGVNQIKKDSQDPISELYDIKLFLIKFLKGEKTSPLYQLQKILSINSYRNSTKTI